MITSDKEFLDLIFIGRPKRGGIAFSLLFGMHITDAYYGYKLEFLDINHGVDIVGALDKGEPS